MITIINLEMGNPSSIKNMIKKIGYNSIISNSIQDIKMADKLILPGVGSFDKAIQNLIRLKLTDTINANVLINKTPILGICLGMQLLSKSSEEGIEMGLGYINGYTVKFRVNCENLKIPHMGWNTIDIKKESPLFYEVGVVSRFYFVHSYHIICEDNCDILAETNHGYDFVSAVEKDNIYGVQFHPEKSHRFGMQILKNFIERV